MTIPIRVLKDSNDNTTGHTEFQSGESVGLIHGGTGANNATDAKTNLGLSSVASSGSFVDLTNKPVVRIYKYEINSAATTWIVQHDKNTTSYNEKLFDSNGDRFYAFVETIDADSFRVHLSESITGYVEVFFNNDVLLSA